MNTKIEQELKRFLSPELIKLIKILKEREYTSEYVLADKIGKDINTTRGLLYQLDQGNLVTITKQKDKVKGWYIYYWKFLDENTLQFLYNKLKSEKEKYEERVQEEENNTFFSCPNKCVRLTFDEATNYEFRCPECGELLVEEDNKDLIKKLKERIKSVDEKIKMVLSEIDKINKNNAKENMKAIESSKKKESKFRKKNIKKGIKVKTSKKAKRKEKKIIRKTKRKEKAVKKKRIKKTNKRKEQRTTTKKKKKKSKTTKKRANKNKANGNRGILHKIIRRIKGL